MYNHLPFEGYSYYIDSENNYHLGAIVPYGPYNYRVEVLFPVLGIVENTVVVPEVTLADFNKWCPMFEEQIKDENHFLYSLWQVLTDVARESIDYELCGSDKRYVQAVCYSTAHFLTIHLRELKDEQNRYTLDPEKKDKELDDKEKEINLVDSRYGNYRATPFGNLFWTIYGAMAKFNLGYAPL